MPNRKNLVYTADDGEEIGCYNISANNTSLGFVEDLKKLTGALPRPKRLEFRKLYATAVSSGMIRVTREFPIGKLDQDIYKKGGTIKQTVEIGGMAEELEFVVTSARGESRSFITSADPGGPAPVPTVTIP